MSKIPHLLLPLLLLPTQAAGQSADTLRIGILVDAVAPEDRGVLDDLIGEISAVVGEDAVVSFSERDLASSEYDLDAARTEYQLLLDGPADVILAFGPVVNEAVWDRETYPKPTILFGAMNQDLIPVGGVQPISGIDNFTYVLTSQSYDRDLRTFKRLYDFRNVGVIVLEAQRGVLQIAAALDQIFETLDGTYELISYQSLADLEPHLSRVDAVYLAEGWGIPDDELRTLANELTQRGIPSFSGVRREDVELGFMASNQASGSLDQLFRRIALHVEAVVAGDNLADRPIFVEFNETLTMNFNTAELVAVPLKYSLIATTEFVGDFVNVLSERTYSLPELVEEALEANLLVALDRKQVELSHQDVRAAWTNYLPTLSANGTGALVDPELAELSAGRNPQYSVLGSVVLSQLLFSPLANASLGIERSLLGAQEQSLRAAELDLILEASNAYFNALLMRAGLQIQKQNLDVTRRNLTIAEQSFEAGQSGRSDVLRLQSAVANDMQALVEAINQLEQAHYDINLLVNQPTVREIDVVDIPMFETRFEEESHSLLVDLLDDQASRVQLEDFLVAEARRISPELSALDHNLEVADRTIALHGAQRYLPTVAAQAQYNMTFHQGGVGAPDPSIPASTENYNVGLNLSVPLFESNSRNVARQTARIQREQLHLNRTFTSNTIDRNVRDIVLELTNQVANLQLSEVSESSAREGLALAQAAFENGAASIVELLDAQTNLLAAQLARSGATYRFLSTGMVLGRSIGHFFLLSTDEENQAFLDRFEAFRAAGPPTPPSPDGI